MSKILKKWNYEKQDYELYEVPDDYKLTLCTDDMDEKINCPHCGKELSYGDAYTSFEIHTEMGFGCNVCPECHEKEWERRLADRRVRA